MRNTLTFVTLSVVVFAAGRLAAIPLQSAQSGQTYIWHGELVALDETARSISVKTPVLAGALDELARFKAGDRVVLTWSGSDRYAHAISHATRYETGKKFDDHFTFPAEFVAVDATQKYLTFKSHVPVESISKLKSLKAGEWITVTSPHGESSDAQPIVAIRQYNDPVSN